MSYIAEWINKVPLIFSVFGPTWPTRASAGVTHPQVHPLVQHPVAVELTQQTRGGDAEGGVGLGAPPTGHIREEVVPQLSQESRAAQQRHGSCGLYATERGNARRGSLSP